MKQPNASSYVEVRYTGKLITGKIFDSGTYKGSLSSTVSGWQEAISMLKVGGSMEMFFPYTLGYNSTDKGTIPPYSMLYFTVELLDAQY
jgi:FKBP-type peptidyl-prolyl cis-trans isomerase FkpA